jgi:hypothetical protein
LRALTIVADNDNPATNCLLDALVCRLRDRGLPASWVRVLPTAPIQDEVILCHDPIPHPCNPDHVCVLGQRLLNRRQRLVVLEAAGIPVVPWASPPSGPAVDALFDRWGVCSIIHKQDSSFRRRGVKLVRRAELTNYDASQDVLMRIVDEDPTTYKIDVFYRTVLGGRAYRTPPIGSPNFYDDELPSDAFEIPEPLARTASEAGRILANYGAGYVSLDFMKHRTEFAVIEANTAGVGITTMWTMSPQSYLERYEHAILDWLAQGGPRATLAAVSLRCREVS